MPINYYFIGDRSYCARTIHVVGQDPEFNHLLRFQPLVSLRFRHWIRTNKKREGSKLPSLEALSLRVLPAGRYRYCLNRSLCPAFVDMLDTTEIRYSSKAMEFALNRLREIDNSYLEADLVGVFYFCYVRI